MSLNFTDGNIYSCTSRFEWLPMSFRQMTKQSNYNKSSIIMSYHVLINKAYFELHLCSIVEQRYIIIFWKKPNFTNPSYTHEFTNIYYTAIHALGNKRKVAYRDSSSKNTLPKENWKRGKKDSKNSMKNLDIIIFFSSRRNRIYAQQRNKYKSYIS